MDKTLIKVKPFHSIRRQKHTIVFLIDDRLHQDSYFHKMCQIVKIDFRNFISRAMAAKKPDRLRKYYTPNSPYAQFTILFHLGLRNKSQTFERDLDNLIEEYQSELTFALMLHDSNFLGYCLSRLLDVIKNHVKSSLTNQFILNKNAASKTRMRAERTGQRPFSSYTSSKQVKYGLRSGLRRIESSGQKKMKTMIQVLQKTERIILSF